MQPDDEICLCHHVTQRKLAAFLARERPQVASQLSECLGAGTGCGWCVPYLERLHERWAAGESIEILDDPEHYAEARRSYRQSGRRD